MAVDIRRCTFSLRHAIASWRRQFVECETVLQTDESELDSDVTVQNRGKSQLRVDSSFRITRDCPQTSLHLVSSLCTWRSVIRHEVFFLAETCVYSHNSTHVSVLLIQLSARMPQDMRGTAIKTVSRFAGPESIHDNSQNNTEIGRRFGCFGFADADLRPRRCWFDSFRPQSQASRLPVSIRRALASKRH